MRVRIPPGPQGTVVEMDGAFLRTKTCPHRDERPHPLGRGARLIWNAKVAGSTPAGALCAAAQRQSIARLAQHHAQAVGLAVTSHRRSARAEARGLPHTGTWGE